VRAQHGRVARELDSATIAAGRGVGAGPIHRNVLEHGARGQGVDTSARVVEECGARNVDRSRIARNQAPPQRASRTSASHDEVGCAECPGDVHTFADGIADGHASQCRVRTDRNRSKRLAHVRAVAAHDGVAQIHARLAQPGRNPNPVVVFDDGLRKRDRAGSRRPEGHRERVAAVVVHDRAEDGYSSASNIGLLGDQRRSNGVTDDDTGQLQRGLGEGADARQIAAPGRSSGPRRNGLGRGSTPVGVSRDRRRPRR